MNPWIVLLPYFVCLAIGAFFSYRSDLRDGRWFLPVYVACGLGTSLLWVWACRKFGDVNRIYFLSLCADLLMVLCYYVLPLLVFELRFNRWTGLGVGLMVLGLAVVKVKG